MRFIFLNILFIIIILLTGCTNKKEIFIKSNQNNKVENNLILNDCKIKIENHKIKSNNYNLEIKICSVNNYVVNITVKTNTDITQYNGMRLESCQSNKTVYIHQDLFLCY